MKSRQLLNGIIGGLAGGVIFGVMMGVMGMLPMIGKMVGQPSAVVGFLIHMINSAIIGAGFAVVFGSLATRLKSGFGFGLLYGVIWWFLGPLTLMPLFLGMGLGVNWNITAAVNMMMANGLWQKKILRHCGLPGVFRIQSDRIYPLPNIR
jgi:hypothetical protein